MSSEKRETLANDFLQMVDNPQFSDVILVCEDGVEVRACRMVLAARSLFFRQMLSNGMAESRETSIALRTVSSSVLLIVLKFLYAEVLLDDDIQNKKDRRKPLSRGQLYRKSRLDWELLLKVVVAVRFFMLEHLEKVIIGRLRDDLPDMGWEISVLDAHDESALGSNLSILCEYSMLWNANEVNFTDDVFDVVPGKSIERICFHLIQRMLFSELRPTTLFNFSRKAFHLYLSKTQRTSSDKTWDWSLEENLKLREIIIWCALKAVDTEAAIQNLECLPGLEIVMEFLDERVESTPAESRSTFSEGRGGVVKNIHREDVEKFLWMVDLVSIHPQL